MRLYRGDLLLSTGVFLLALCAYGQDAPSLGDVARQARLQKQQNSKDAQSKNAAASKTPKVITNEEIPEHPESASEASASSEQDQQMSHSAPDSGKISGEQWKSQIQAQKNLVSTLQNQIDKLNNSIQFAPGTCVYGCVQWNERQKEKQQEVERMRGQLADQKKKLETMQESARRQGYGSTVYDP
jgi:hypothetical protein